jgi:trk system potassium uptake protein TrkA
LADRRVRPEIVVVIGLGRFGTAVAQQLQRLGHEVLAIESDPSLVQAASGEFTHVVSADATDPEALRQLGVHEAHHVVIAIGDNVQASILATATLSDLGVPDIWAKALTLQHATILERIGAHHVVFPEGDMGERVAHRVTGKMLEYVQIDESFALVETIVPASLEGRTLLESGIRDTHRVNVVAIKQPGSTFSHPMPDTRLEPGSLLLVAGDPTDVERFASLA